jgi:hypothetical protein
MFWVPLCPSSGAREYNNNNNSNNNNNNKHVEQARRSAIKIHLLHLVGILFPHINDDAQSKSLQIDKM